MLNVFLKDLIKLHHQGMESVMCSLTLFSLYLNDLLKYKNCVMKTCFHRGFMYKEKWDVIYKENFICKEKSGSATTVKLDTKIKMHNQLYFGTWVLASHCYCGDKA